jgi:xanthine dehydrogenase large subunit
MLATSVFLAIRDAIASCLGPGASPELAAPATPEAVLRALARTRGAREHEHSSAAAEADT